jgi:hypothetical protein
MSNADGVTAVLGNFGCQLPFVNTGMGARNADCTINVPNSLQGLAATAEGQFSMVGKSYGPVLFGSGVWGIYNVYDKLMDNFQSWTIC